MVSEIIACISQFLFLQCLQLFLQLSTTFLRCLLYHPQLLIPISSKKEVIQRHL